jgi:DNA helicase IV
MEVHPAQIIDEKSLTNIEAVILKLEAHVRSKYPHRAGMSPAEAAAFISRLTRSIGFVQILGVRFAREAEQIVQVTTDQLEVLSDLEANPRMLVQGAAGTGKTIIAQTFAKRLAESQKEVLLLFFNRGIAKHARYAFPKDSTVNVSTFSSFAKRLVEQHDPEWWEAEKESSNEFWHTTLPLKLMDIPASELPKFDAVIVDEGQDFKPEWFEFLSTVLRDPENSFYTVLLDEKQDIFGHWKNFPCRPKPFHKVLTKNCRNTKQIVTYLKKKYPTNMTSFERSPHGTSVRERHVVDETDELKRITDDVRILTSKENVKPGSIVILINAPKEESCLRAVNEIAGFKLQSTYAGYDPTARHLYYSTIDIFKGLEADVILLCAAGIPSADLPRALYVRGSRAKHLLYVYGRVDA